MIGGAERLALACSGPDSASQCGKMICLQKAGKSLPSLGLTIYDLFAGHYLFWLWIRWQDQTDDRTLVIRL